MDTAWRLEELVQRVVAALAAAPYDGQSSRRVREVPDGRTVRYYTTLGILDRPLEMRGRTAYYGPRHLLQLVAIKRLQAQGMSLTEIQRRLTGVNDKTLRRWAALPDDFWQSAELAAVGQTRSKGAAIKQIESPVETGTEAKTLQRRPRGAFWAAQPAPSTTASGLPSDVVVEASPAVVLSLGPGVSLTIAGDAARRLDEEKLAAIKPVVEQLLAELEREERGASPSPRADSD